MATYPPGPKGHWLTGQLPEYRRDRLGFLTRCAREYGDVVAIRLGHRRIFLLNHPDLLETVLVTENRRCIKHFALRLNPLVFGNGLLTSEGDFWRRQRRLMQPAFQRQRVAEYAATVITYTERMLAGWQPGQVRPIHTDMLGLTLEIAAKVLFGAEAGGQADEVRQALEVLQDFFLSRSNRLLPTPIWIPTPETLRLRWTIRRLNNVLYGFIHQRRQQQGTNRDLLSLLLAARDEQDHTGMTDKQLRDEAMTLFLAGHETTALVLSWTWYLLATHPEVEERLATEVREVLGGQSATAESLPRLAFTEKVVLESMRVFSPIYLIGREAIQEFEVGGYRVPVGTTLMMSQWVLHRDPRFWAQPEKFDPDRWTEDQECQRPRFAYFPFGGGPRICIGNPFAMMETVLILATIAQRFRFTLQPGHVVDPAPTFTLRPGSPIPAPVTLRT